MIRVGTIIGKVGMERGRKWEEISEKLLEMLENEYYAGKKEKKEMESLG